MARPKNIWQGLSQALKHQAIDDITTICTEVIYEHLRTHYPVSPGAPATSSARKSTWVRRSSSGNFT